MTTKAKDKANFKVRKPVTTRRKIKRTLAKRPPTTTLKPKRTLTVRKIRAKVVASKISENIGLGKKINIGKAMRKAGYSESYSKTPKHLTNTMTFQELMKEKLPDEPLIKKVKELIDTKKVIIQEKEVKGKKLIEVISTNVIDVIAASKGLDFAFRLKGSYAPEKMRIIRRTVSLTKLFDKSQDND